MARVLIVSHTTGYQLRAFNDAAETLGIALMFATDRCHKLDDPWQDHAIAVRFHDPQSAVAAIVARARQQPVDGIIAVGDRPVALAARAAEALGIHWHSVAGAEASTDKRRSREAIASAGLPSPRFTIRDARSRMRDSGLGMRDERFPLVLKPLGLSGSRGVIRADDAEAFAAAFERIRALLARPQIRAARRGLEDEILVEEYIAGREVAVEGVLTSGRLQVFAIFDKPDPLEGPFFEETIYVTPSGLPSDLQSRVVDHVQRASVALGLRQGPIHAECRVTDAGVVYVLEVAARPIGGLCSRVLAFVRSGSPGVGAKGVGPRQRTEEAPQAGGSSLEGILLRHAAGEPIDRWTRERAAAAVMMSPIPQRGIFKGVHGEEAARRVPGVTDVRITAKIGQLLEPLPEAGSYLGFIFARGAMPSDAERAVRTAHRALAFTIEREIPVAP
jgi:hypothetical protein